LGKLPDDNYNYIPLTIYRFGSIDPVNARVDVEIINFDKEGVEKICGILYNMIK
jgi:hypothetical protein